MSSKGLRLVNWGLWAPAAGLMRRLRFPGKMALISIGFLLPVAWLLTQFLISEHEHLNFVEAERDGVHYAQALYPALQAADQWRYVARSAAFGGSADALPAARASFDTAMADLRTRQQDMGARLNTGVAWEELEQSLAQVKDTASPDEVYQAMTGLSRELTELLDTVWTTRAWRSIRNWPPTTS